MDTKLSDPKQRSSSISRSQLEIPRPLFPKLPLDVLFCFLDCFEPADSIAFALSCKTLYSSCFGQALSRLRNQSTTVAQRQGVHLMLEREQNGQAYYCHSCNTLHEFSPDWRATSKIGGIKSCYDCKITNQTFFNFPYGESKSEFEPQFSLDFDSPGLTTTYRVDYVLARLVMNRHLLGTQAGLPLSCLEVQNLDRLQTEDLQFSKPFTLTQTWRARIIDDELYLSAIYSFTQLSVGERAHQRFWDCFYSLSSWIRDRLFSTIGLCSHVQTGYRGVINHPSSFQSHACTQLNQSHMHTLNYELDSCHHCLSDFEASTKWRSLDGTYSEYRPRNRQELNHGLSSVTITTYHQLGKCRSPLDWKWAAASTPTSASMLWARDQAQYPLGIVRDRWQEFDRSGQESESVATREATSEACT